MGNFEVRVVHNDGREAVVEYNDLMLDGPHIKRLCHSFGMRGFEIFVYAVAHSGTKLLVTHYSV